MADSDQHDVTHDLQGEPSPPHGGSPPKQPKQIGRYRIEKLLGKGGFGLVYLAHDEQLDRLVAVKVPHARLVSRAEDAELYLAEARTVASLDHPHIVPVHDVGSTEECPCYVVSKYIDGTDLSTTLRESRPSYTEAAELVATMAEALHYSHKQGLVHRDVKPGNILIGKDGKPYVVDFGLALREENIGTGPKYAGTPAYMSPEQARGEGHRVDGRSDVFSLGVVLYELLVGRRPFKADTQAELLEQITSFDPKPPRQVDDSAPRELERICLKALSKRATERYTTAKDLAEDLRHFLSESPRPVPAARSTTPDSPPETQIELDTPPATPGSDTQPIKIVPKGLRSFDEHDADFFLELLPGARDREGLPDSVRFWKSRIEETDADKTFSVGLVYGHSGCGKSSLVKAGLLPRLREHIIPVYIEATPDETESSLLRGLRKQCPEVAHDLSLQETLTALRRGQGIPAGQKVLIVLDQFEQWLHAKKEEENTQLVQALRQCDGGNVQCIVMVRDDFWMAATRFMRELEIRLLEASNSASVDLLPLRHAERVLAAFGRAFGILPENASDLAAEQREFLTEAAAGLAEENKVICVRLALFAEMMKGRSWTPAILKEVGGTRGIGVTFLEETFAASTAPPEHRYHQKAARAVLKALLPDSGTDIKGHMRSEQELLQASSYVNRPQKFADLIRILDSEIRLITPTDPQGVDGEDDSRSPVQAGPKYYQLTHDYLVPSLHDWLTRKQKETRRGRAELRLAERSALWSDKPENRHLPSWWEWASIRTLTAKSEWSETQGMMMSKATRFHASRWGTSLVALLLVSVTIQQMLAAAQRKDLAERTTLVSSNLQNTIAPGVPFVLDDLGELPVALVRQELQKRFSENDDSQDQRLAYGLARFGHANQVVDYLVSRVKDAQDNELENFVAALGSAKTASLSAIKAAATTSEQQEDWPSKARLAILATRLGDNGLASDMCQIEERPDPVQRTVFIDSLSRWHGNLKELAQQVGDVADASLKSAVSLGVGSISPQDVIEKERESWQEILSAWYLNELDTGTHSAAGWVLRGWGMPLPAIAPEEHHPTEEQRQRSATLAAEVETLEQRLVTTKQEAETRQLAWEAQLRERTVPLPDSLGNGLVAHFPLDEVAADEIDNVAPEQPNAHYRGPTRPEWVPGVLGQAVRLGDGYVDCGDTFQPDDSDAFSFGCWYYSENAEQRSALIAKLDSAANRGFDLWTEGGRIGATLTHNGPRNAIKALSVYAVPNNSWHHVFVNYDGSRKASGVSVFVDGQPVKTQPTWDSLTDTIQTDAPLTIGRLSGEKPSPFKGLIDDARLYDRRLASDEVRQLYESGVQSLATIPGASRTVQQQQALVSIYSAQDNRVKEAKSELRTATVQLDNAQWAGRRQWQVDDFGLTMLRIPPGSFVREIGRNVEQTVRLSDSFLLSDREISIELFQQFVNDTNYPEDEKPKDWEGAREFPESSPKHPVPSPKHPVQQVSWYDSVLFCNWLSRKRGLEPCYERTGEQEKIGSREEEHDAWRLIADADGYRLPSEAEWEYACRAGSTTPFGFGEEEASLKDYDVYIVNASSQTAVCGTRLSNAWGLFDMHGNVVEWCGDWFGSYPGETIVDDPLGPDGGSSRVHRGGGWGMPAGSCQSSIRVWSLPSNRSVHLGFRVARAPLGSGPRLAKPQ